MTLEEQVTRVDISIKLRDLGVKQFESYFNWIRRSPTDSYTLAGSTWKTGDKDGRIDCFTVAELGKIIPGDVKIERYPEGKVWNIYWTNGKKEPDFRSHILWDKSMANALGKMLIWIIEEKLI